MHSDARLMAGAPDLMVNTHNAPDLKVGPTRTVRPT
jgi:hypothetical protein